MGAPFGRGLDHDVANLVRRAGLAADQAQHELMVRFLSRRVDHVACA